MLHPLHGLQPWVKRMQSRAQCIRGIPAAQARRFRPFISMRYGNFVKALEGPQSAAHERSKATRRQMGTANATGFARKGTSLAYVTRCERRQFAATSPPCSRVYQTMFERFSRQTHTAPTSWTHHYRRSSRPKRSRFRAPDRMPFSPILPSWQAYSKMGPSVRRSGIRAVKGAVYSVGSMTVYS